MTEKTTDVPVTDADRAVVRDYHRQPGRKGESNDQQLARLVAERVHAATAALQGEVERLKKELVRIQMGLRDVDDLRIEFCEMVDRTEGQNHCIVRLSGQRDTLYDSLQLTAEALEAAEKRRDFLSGEQYQVECALSDAGYRELESESEGVKRLAAERDALKAERDSYQHFCSLNGMAEMQKERDALQSRVAELTAARDALSDEVKRIEDALDRAGFDKFTANEKAIDELAARVAELEREVEQLSSRREHVKMTKRSKHVLWLADDERKRMGHTVVGTEHLLLGLMREHSGVATNALKNLGLKLETVREEVLRLLGVESNCPETPDSSPPPVERASVLLTDDEQRLIVHAKSFGNRDEGTLITIIDRLQAALAERDEKLEAAERDAVEASIERDEASEDSYEQSGLITSLQAKARNLEAQLTELQRRPQVVAPVGSFVPNGRGEPQVGDWYATPRGNLFCRKNNLAKLGVKDLYRRIDEPCGYEFALRLVGENIAPEANQFFLDVDNAIYQMAGELKPDGYPMAKVWELIPLAPAEAAGDGLSEWVAKLPDEIREAVVQMTEAQQRALRAYYGEKPARKEMP